MKEYIDEMLRLTAAIADRLLLIKDTDGEIDPQLNLDIQNLAVISDRETTRVIAEYKEPEPETEPLIEPAPEEETCEEAIADSAEFEETEDAEVAVEDMIGEAAVAGEQVAPVSITEEDTVSDNEMISEGAEFEVVNDACPAKLDVAVLRKAFSLNDIFLYRRTLFGGSAERFNQTLEATAAMTSADELRRYLADVQQVNIKTPVAKDFIAVLGSFLECD